MSRCKCFKRKRLDYELYVSAGRKRKSNSSGRSLVSSTTVTNLNTQPNEDSSSSSSSTQQSDEQQHGPSTSENGIEILHAAALALSTENTSQQLNEDVPTNSLPQRIDEQRGVGASTSENQMHRNSLLVFWAQLNGDVANEDSHPQQINEQEGVSVPSTNENEIPTVAPLVTSQSENTILVNTHQNEHSYSPQRGSGPSTSTNGNEMHRDATPVTSSQRSSQQLNEEGPRIKQTSSEYEHEIIEAKYAATIKKIQGDNAATIKKIRDDHAAAIKKIRDENAATMKRNRDEFEAELKKNRDEFAAAMRKYKLQWKKENIYNVS